MGATVVRYAYINDSATAWIDTLSLQDERPIVWSQGRGKPMAALVSVEDLARLEKDPVAPKGLMAAVGALADFEGLDSMIEEIYRRRGQAQRRPVELEP